MRRDETRRLFLARDPAAALVPLSASPSYGFLVSNLLPSSFATFIVPLPTSIAPSCCVGPVCVIPALEYPAFESPAFESRKLPGDSRQRIESDSLSVPP